MTKERMKALANLVIEIVVLANLVLTAMGKNPIPFDDEGALEVASYLLAAAQTLHIWWKNQNITVEAETGQRVIDDMKASKEMAGGETDPLGDDAE